MDADGTERKTSFGYMYIKHEKAVTRDCLDYWIPTFLLAYWRITY